jgi:hypothetical protein
MQKVMPVGEVPVDYGLPQGLRPELASDTFPRVSVPDLSQLKRTGWARFGIVAAVVDEQQRIMMLEHRPSDKTPAGALGPLAETSQLARTRNGLQVEHAAETLARGFKEELGTDPTQLQLVAKKVGSWALNSWPVGALYTNQQAFAVCPVVRVGAEQRDRLVGEFTGTDEISAVRFMTTDEIRRQENVRTGTHAWLGDVAASGLMEVPADDSFDLQLTGSTMPADALDIKFHLLEDL